MSWLPNDTEISPEDFEKEIQDQIRILGPDISNFEVRRRQKLLGLDGEYEIDVLVNFEMLGANFLVLIECKKHKNSIKREVVQILNDRLRSTGAQKGMIFSTASFQSGAIGYAYKHGIALIQLVDGKYTYHTKSFNTPTSYPPGLPEFACYITYLSDDGNESYRLIHERNVEFLSTLFVEKI